MGGLGLLWSLGAYGSDGGGWLAFCGTVRLLLLGGGMASSSVACFAGLVYLEQSRRLRRKRPLRLRFTLPSLERSERWNRRAITLAFPLLTSGLALGAGLALATRQGPASATSSMGSGGLGAAGAWWASALLLLARFQPALRGRRMMALTAMTFAMLVFSGLGIDPILPTARGIPRAIASPPGRVVAGRWIGRNTTDAQAPVGVIPTMFQVRLESAWRRNRDGGPTVPLSGNEESR